MKIRIVIPSAALASDVLAIVRAGKDATAAQVLAAMRGAQ